jgi:hypothetical protein
MDSLFRNF